MKFFKTKKGIIILVAVVLFAVLLIRHTIAENSVFYKAPCEKVNITEVLSKETLSGADYMLIYEQTGISPLAAKELLADGSTELITQLHDLYFKEPAWEKNYIVRPFTVQEFNKNQLTPLVCVKKGDILITFNTRTLDWRHGHCGLVLDEKSGSVLEHMSIGVESCETSLNSWGLYPAFAILRYEDSAIAQNAADYAKENLLGIKYNIFAGLIKKDKTSEKSPSSHCSHIVWQAYKAQGVDIDKNGGAVVSPRDIAFSGELKVVQIYGLNPKHYTSRILK